MKKRQQKSIMIDLATYEAMNEYAALYNLSLSDLVNRMWSLWSRIEDVRAILPTFPLLQENLDTFMAEMEGQAINLDEEYRATRERNQAITDYQSEHPFVPDSDETLVECPFCHRQTTKAGLVYLPGGEVRCDACYTLPHLLVDYERQFEQSASEDQGR